MRKRSYTSLCIRSIDLKTKKEIKKEKDLYEVPLLQHAKGLLFFSTRMAKTNTNQKKTAQKTMSVKKEIRRKRSTKKKELEKETDKGAIQLGRKRIFNDGEELLELFNLYLASIQTKTVNELGEEQWNFKEFPSKLRFYVFLGGMSRETWSDYKTKAEFSDTIQFIEDFFESELEIRGLDGRHSASMTQFVLNTTYGRNPKNITDEDRNVSITFTS